MDIERKKKFWQRISIASGILLIAAFILLFYSLYSIYDCAGNTFLSNNTFEAVKGCGPQSLKVVQSFNLALIGIILFSTTGIVVGLTKAGQIERRQDEAEYDEPPVEVRSNNSNLPDVKK